MKKRKLVLAIRSLNIGGAERQFIELVKGIDKSLFELHVCVMYPGAMDDEVRNIPGITFHSFEKRGRYDLGFLFRYKEFLRQLQPDIIYSWLGEMNLFSYWAKPSETKLVWSFRASDMDLSKYGLLPQFLFWLQKKYSKNVDKIIANSNAAIESHKSVGFDVSRTTVVYNGIDTDRFSPDRNLKEAFRKEQKVKKNQIAIGMVARLDPMKGYPIFAQAANTLLKRYDNIVFFAAGGGNRAIQEECEALLDSEVKQRFIWLGRRNDVETVFNGLDVVVSASTFGEGFSNSIAEAMACGTPCVVTDVGDSAFLVGDSGMVVAPKCVEALEAGIEKMLHLDRRVLGEEARKRIVENFSVAKMVQRTQEELLACVE